jgi:hypothetical protein
VIAVLLVAVAAAVALVAPRVLVSASWVYRAPMLGIAAWYAVLFSVTAAVSLGVVSLVIPWSRTVDALCSLWRWCAEALRGEYGFAGHLAGGVLVGALPGGGDAARRALGDSRRDGAAPSRACGLPGSRPAAPPRDARAGAHPEPALGPVLVEPRTDQEVRAAIRRVATAIRGEWRSPPIGMVASSSSR